MKYLVVGLGNMGAEYEQTRHNIGFRVVEALAAAAGRSFEVARYGDVARVSIKGRDLILLKPSTYVNLSGNAVRYWLQKEHIPQENLLIVLDDLSLPVGALRLKARGSDAGHNGLKHIATTLGTQDYARLRIGIGNDYPRGTQIDFVLGHFSPEEEQVLTERIPLATEAIKSFALAGLALSMNTYNKK
jgi:PTH1 family peptidyl-tRNA hydrolase